MKKTLELLATLTLSTLLVTSTGCSSDTPLSRVYQADEMVPFIDLDRFDRQLSQSLASPLSQVNVPLLERVPPSQIPGRLKVWLNAIEKAGGKVLVQDPPNESSSEPKNPFLIFTLLNNLENKNSSTQTYAHKDLLTSTKDHNVKVFLIFNASNEVVVEKVTFTKK